MNLGKQVPGMPGPPPGDFLGLSRRIGSDRMLVQGPGGNTSVKSGGAMWIKASGTRLADSGLHRVFLPVDIDRVIAEFNGGGDGSCTRAVIGSPHGLRPSIETTFHAVLPRRFVFHYHSVLALCHLISPEGIETLPRKLDGLDWTLAEYRKPGIPLTREIEASLGAGNPEVVLLKNHGVIVAADRISRVASLIGEVEDRLELPVSIHESRDDEARQKGLRQDSPVNRGTETGSTWEWCPGTVLFSIRPELRRRMSSGVFFPDQAVFLGPSLPLLSLKEIAEGVDPGVPAVIVDGAGIFARRDSLPEVKEMVLCLSDVFCRLPGAWSVATLAPRDVEELINWDAEEFPPEVGADAGLGMSLFLGVDFGTSGVRTAVIDEMGGHVASCSVPLPAPVFWRRRPVQNPEVWWDAFAACMDQLSNELGAVKRHVSEIVALSVDGTSGTLLLADSGLRPVTPALMYNSAGFDTESEAIARCAPRDSIVRGASSALARLIFLQKLPEARDAAYAMHQADWVAARLAGKGGISDENNVLKLGYGLVANSWPTEMYGRLAVRVELLPEVLPVGHTAGTVCREMRTRFGFAPGTRVVSGTTDSVASFVASGATRVGEGVTSLGTTIVLKFPVGQFDQRRAVWRLQSSGLRPMACRWSIERWRWRTT